MKLKFKLTLLSFICIPFVNAQIKIDKEHFINLLDSGKYDQAYNELTDLQKKPCGKNCLTDYLIAKSLCLSELYEPAKSRYKNILSNYKKLPDNLRAFIMNEEADCNNNSNTTIFSEQAGQQIRVFPMGIASVYGKLGKVYNCYQNYEAMHITKTVSEKEFASRLFAISQPDSAIKKIKSIVPASYSVTSSGSLILVTPASQDSSIEKKKDNAISDLIKTTNFFSSWYNLRLPEYFITAYIVPDNASLRKISESIHGLRVPNENYGYSSINDLSVLAATSEIGTGTLRHELFHIIVRGDIGDIPAWLDEGIATLYEQSHWQHDTLLCDKIFWRNQVLKESLAELQLYMKLPDLRKLINYSWTEFEGSDNGDICKAYVNYALAKHFVLYLEKTGRLKSVLNAYKNKRSNDKTISIKTNDRVLEEACGTSIDSLETDFDKWLINKYSFSILNPMSNQGISHESKRGIEVFANYNRYMRKLHEMHSALNPQDSVAIAINRLKLESETKFNQTLNVYDEKRRKITSASDSKVIYLQDSLLNDVSKINFRLKQELKLN